jgi:cyclic beta-1,2-glucan synthetase
VAASRVHRWMRGDWQLLPLLRPGRLPLAGVHRWKMLDNLRRSLSAPGMLLVLLSAWAIPQAPEALLVGLVLTALAMPALFALAHGLVPPPNDFPLGTHLRTTGENVLLGLVNGLVGLALLAQQAWLMADAIVSTLVRVLVTRRKLLKWVTALQAKTVSGHGLKTVIRPLGSATAVIVGAGGVVLLFNPAGMASAAPFLLLWWLAPLLARGLSLPPKPDPSWLNGSVLDRVKRSNAICLWDASEKQQLHITLYLDSLGGYKKQGPIYTHTYSLVA